MMDQATALLEAIRQDPGSDSVRLIYADWLEERGNPYADFIRLQCSLKKARDYSPRYFDLDAQAHALKMAHEAEWLGPMLGQITDWEFSRGMLEYIGLPTETFLANAERWLPNSPVLGLYFRNSKKHIADLAACPQLAHVNALFLGDNGLDDEDLRVLLESPYLKNLRVLFLHKNNISDKGAALLAKSPAVARLEELNLSMTEVEDKGVKALLRSNHLTNLKILRLNMMRLQRETFRELANSALLSRLTELDLSASFAPQGTLKHLVESEAFSRLHSLNYSMNYADHEDLKALAKSPHVRKLSMLSLKSVLPFTDTSLRALADSPNLRRLRHFTFEIGCCTAKGLTKLANSQHLTSLRTLKVEFSEDETDGRVAKLLDGPLVSRLHHLDLETHELGKHGMAALLRQPAPMRLLNACLSLSKKGIDGWEALLERGFLRRLTTLKIDAPPETSLLPMLVPGSLPRLRMLALDGMPKDHRQIEQLIDHPMMSQLCFLALCPHNDDRDRWILRRLTAKWSDFRLQQLGLHWTLTPEDLSLLTEARLPATLSRLLLGSYQLKEADIRKLADWPGLQQLRILSLSNCNPRSIPGMEAVAQSAWLGPLLRMEILNGGVTKEARTLLRRRMGRRFAIMGFDHPRVLCVSGNIFDYGPD